MIEQAPHEERIGEALLLIVQQRPPVPGSARQAWAWAVLDAHDAHGREFAAGTYYADPGPGHVKAAQRIAIDTGRACARAIQYQSMREQFGHE